MNNDDKIDKILETLTEIKVTLGKQHVSLNEHMRRTNLLETSVDILKKHMNQSKIVGFIFITALGALGTFVSILKG